MLKHSCLFVLFVLSCAAQNAVPGVPVISIETLRNGFPGMYNKEKVAVRGWVAHERRVPSKTFPGYNLRDRYGDIILVRTTEPLPDITSEIQVTGVALKDADSREVYLSEIQRLVLTSTPPPPPPKKDDKPVNQGHTDGLSPLQVGIGVAVIVLVLGAAFLMTQQRRQGIPPPKILPKSPLDLDSGGVAGQARFATPAPQPQEYATVKVYPTTKVLPGQLIVMVNKQETDVIHLCDQSGNGEVEIGRDSPDVMGGIRVKDKTNTVSRRQAKLLYSPLAKEFKLVNLAGENANPTIVNGHSLTHNQTVVLSDNDVVGMGSLELKFRSN